MRLIISVMLAGVVALAWCSAADAATAAAKKVAKPVEAIRPADCVTAECHVNIKRYKVLHGPVNVNNCDACHELVDAKEHKFQATRQKAELCTFCHEFRVDKMPVVHEPIRKGECLGCHDPHGGQSHSLTLGDTTPELCGRCHESITKGKKFLHGPAASGDCSSCHRAHASRFPKMLDAQGPDLCLTCHTKLQAKLASVRFTHKAMEEGCARCHDAHGSNQAMDLTQASSQLCLSCHDKVKEEVGKATYKHTVVMAERGCVTCHTPHGSDLAKLMSDYPLKICMDCHSQEIKVNGGPSVAGGERAPHTGRLNGAAESNGATRTIAAMTMLSDPRTIKHGPIKDGQCTGCHKSHGGQRPAFLVKDYSEAFYQRYNPANYDLCFSCHDVKLAQQEQSNGLTGFRDGDRNLHFVHVDKSDRSRNCGVCHSTHASLNPRHMRDFSMFGKWKLPIGYTKTENGGTCESGCHGTFSYDRVKPVGTKIQTTKPVRVVSAELPPAVKWNVQDAGGNRITVPAADRPTVLLFARAEADNSAVIKLVSPAINDRHKAQALLILEGAGATEKAAAMAQARTSPWPVIADAECGLSRQLGIYAWPATLVIASDGSQLAHRSGTEQHLTAELEAYLDFAAGKINRPALDQRLATSEVADDGTEKKVACYVDLAGKLLEEGKAEPARVLLVDALKLRPDSLAAQTGMVRSLIALKKTNDAMQLLAKLRPSLPAWERDLLQAKLMAGSNQWWQARSALESVLKARPDIAEAHFLMGAVYEQERNWQKAAEEYKAAETAKGN